MADNNLGDTRQLDGFLSDRDREQFMKRLAPSTIVRAKDQVPPPSKDAYRYLELGEQERQDHANFTVTVKQRDYYDSLCTASALSRKDKQPKHVSDVLDAWVESSDDIENSVIPDRIWREIGLAEMCGLMDEIKPHIHKMRGITHSTEKYLARESKGDLVKAERQRAADEQLGKIFTDQILPKVIQFLESRHMITPCSRKEKIAEDCEKIMEVLLIPLGSLWLRDSQNAKDQKDGPIKTAMLTYILNHDEDDALKTFHEALRELGHTQREIDSFTALADTFGKYSGLAGRSAAGPINQLIFSVDTADDSYYAYTTLADADLTKPEIREQAIRAHEHAYLLLKYIVESLSETIQNISETVFINDFDPSLIQDEAIGKAITSIEELLKGYEEPGKLTYFKSKQDDFIKKERAKIPPLGNYPRTKQLDELESQMQSVIASQGSLVDCWDMFENTADCLRKIKDCPRDNADERNQLTREFYVNAMKLGKAFKIIRAGLESATQFADKPDWHNDNYKKCADAIRAQAQKHLTKHNELTRPLQEMVDTLDASMLAVERTVIHAEELLKQSKKMYEHLSARHEEIERRNALGPARTKA